MCIFSVEVCVCNIGIQWKDLTVCLFLLSPALTLPAYFLPTLISSSDSTTCLCCHTYCVSLLFKTLVWPLLLPVALTFTWSYWHRVHQHHFRLKRREDTELLPMTTSQNNITEGLSSWILLYYNLPWFIHK